MDAESVRLLGQIEGRLIGIEKGVVEGQESRRIIHADLAALREQLQQLSLVEQRITTLERTVCNTLKPVAEDYKKMKNRGWGVLFAAGIVGGGIATGLQKLFNGFH